MWRLYWYHRNNNSLIIIAAYVVLFIFLKYFCLLFLTFLTNKRVHNGLTLNILTTNACQSPRSVEIIMFGSNHHRLRGSASPVLTATSLVDGKGQFSTPHRIDTPQPITKIFVTGDYVGDPYGCAKLGAYPSMGGFWAHG